jgi:hypothetical protein
MPVHRKPIVPQTVDPQERQRIALPQPDLPLAAAVRGGKWLVTSAGLAGVFAVLGFLVDSSNEDLLGYQIPGGEGITRYPFLAGQFVVDSLALLFAWVGSHLAVAAAVFLAMLAVKYLFTRLDLTKKRTLGKRVPPRMVPSRLKERPDLSFELAELLPHLKTRIILVGALLLTILVALDFPTLGVKDMLVTTVDAGATMETSTFVGSTSYDLWRDHVCSRVEGETQVAALAARDVHCQPSAAAHTAHLRGFYLLNFFLTVLGFTMLVGLMRKQLQQRTIVPPAHRVVEYEWQLLAPLIAVIAALDVAGLPYAYGKTIRSTLANEIVADLDVKAVAGDGPAAAADSTPPPAAVQVSGFLLETGSESVVLFITD